MRSAKFRQLISEVSRRRVLQIGGAGLLSPRTLSATSGDALVAKADHCIVLFLNGGPSHLDMWDMKPEAPLEIRGEFDPIESSLPGVPVSEHMPRLAQQMHRTTLIRSMHHSVNNAHAAAVYAALTGHDRGELGGGAMPTDNPSPGSVLAKLRPAANRTLPYISLPYKTKEGAGGPLQPGFLAGFMGPTFDPFWVLNNPDATDFHVDNLALPVPVTPQRMGDRSRLLSGLGRGLQIRNEPSLSAIDDFQSRAFDLLTSDTAQHAFDLDQETPEMRARYGRNIYGQSYLFPGSAEHDQGFRRQIQRRAVTGLQVGAGTSPLVPDVTGTPTCRSRYAVCHTVVGSGCQRDMGYAW